MALTLERWIAVALAGFLLAAALLLKPATVRERERSERDVLVNREYRASVIAGMAATRFRATQLVDSVRRSIAAGRADSSRVVVGRGFGPGATALIRTSMKRAAMLRGARTAGVDVAFVLDTASIVRGRQIDHSHSLMSLAHVLPAGAADRCLAIARVRPQAAWETQRSTWSESWFTSVQNAAAMLGPCAFYETYGTPGAGIDRWLRSGGWRFGRYGSLTRARPLPELWDYWSSPIPWHSISGWPLRTYTTSLGYRCVTGDAATCAAQLLEPAADPESDSRMRIHDGVLHAAARYYGDDNGRALGVNESALLSDMARNLGPDRFRRFWTSDQPPAAAFAAASGQDLGNWVAEWARSTYGAQGRGPGMSATGTLLAIVVVLAMLAAATVASRRRQVA